MVPESRKETQKLDWRKVAERRQNEQHNKNRNGDGNEASRQRT